MRKIVHRSHAQRINSSARIFVNALKKLTNAMASPIVTMDQMNSVVLQWSQINATKKNISDAKHQEFAFQSLGTVMDLTIAMITPTNKIVDQFRVQIISSSARTQSACLKLTFAMEKTIVETALTNHTNTLALLLHSNVLAVNGNVQELQLVALT